MISEEALALRGQLIKARANISARVQELKERAIGIGRSVRDAPPHYRSLIAELEGHGSPPSRSIPFGVASGQSARGTSPSIASCF